MYIFVIQVVVWVFFKSFFVYYFKMFKCNLEKWKKCVLFWLNEWFGVCVGPYFLPSRGGFKDPVQRGGESGRSLNGGSGGSQKLSKNAPKLKEAPACLSSLNERRVFRGATRPGFEEELRVILRSGGGKRRSWHWAERSETPKKTKETNPLFNSLRKSVSAGKKRKLCLRKPKAKFWWIMRRRKTTCLGTTITPTRWAQRKPHFSDTFVIYYTIKLTFLICVYCEATPLWRCLQRRRLQTFTYCAQKWTTKLCFWWLQSLSNTIFFFFFRNDYFLGQVPELTETEESINGSLLCLHKTHMSQVLQNIMCEVWMESVSALACSWVDRGGGHGGRQILTHIDAAGGPPATPPWKRNIVFECFCWIFIKKWSW